MSQKADERLAELILRLIETNERLKSARYAVENPELVAGKPLDNYDAEQRARDGTAQELYGLIKLMIRTGIEDDRAKRSSSYYQGGDA